MQIDAGTGQSIVAKKRSKGLIYRWIVDEKVLRCGIDVIHQRSAELLQFETMRSVVVEGLYILAELGQKEALELMNRHPEGDWWKGSYPVFLGLDAEEIQVLTDVRVSLTAIAERQVRVGEVFSLAVCEMAGGRRRKRRVGGRGRIV